MGRGFATYDKVKELACKKMVSVSDKKFFSAPDITSYIRGFVEGMMHRYNEKASFPGKIEWLPKSNAYLAKTNGSSWLCNAGHPMLRKAKSKIQGVSDRLFRLLLLTGFAIHETGHKLYTNFYYENTVIVNELKNGILFPTPTIKTDDWEQLKECMATKKYTNSIIYLYMNISNALEDGYIEYRLLNDFPHPSVKNALEGVRQLHFSEMQTLEEAIASEDGNESRKLFTIVNMLLGYAKYGQIKCAKSEYSDERIQAVIRCIPYIDECNECFDTYTHYQSISNVFALLSPYILEYLNSVEESEMSDDECREKIESSLDDSMSLSEEKLEEKLSCMDRPMDDSMPEKKESASKDSTKDASEDGKEGECKGEKEKGSEDESAHIPGRGITEDDSEDDDDDVSDEMREDSIDPSSETTESPSDLESEDLPDYSDKCSEKLKPKYTPVEDCGTDWEKISETAKKVIYDEATKEAVEELEGEHLETLRQEDASTDYGYLHIGRGCRIERQKDIPESQISAYHTLSEDFLRLSKVANREYIKKIKELSEEDVMRGRYSGQFDVSGCYRADKRMFSKKRLPSPVSLSIFLLIDESGSMRGNRIEMARITAIIIEQFCRMTGIRLCIMGHTEDFNGKHNVRLTSYTDFESYDKFDRYRLMRISAKENNRDGYALRYAMNHIRKEPSDVKLIINISDGEPAAQNYHGKPAIAELQALVKECERNNISVISAAIGSDREVIKSIYGKGFLNISDLEMLPKTLIALIKKYMPDA